MNKTPTPAEVEAALEYARGSLDCGTPEYDEVADILVKYEGTRQVFLSRVSAGILALEIDRLKAALINAGVCPDCGGEIDHDMVEPFAAYPCQSYGEWTSKPPVICELRFELREWKQHTEAVENIIRMALEYKGAPLPYDINEEFENLLTYTPAHPDGPEN